MRTHTAALAIWLLLAPSAGYADSAGAPPGGTSQATGTNRGFDGGDDPNTTVPAPAAPTETVVELEPAAPPTEVPGGMQCGTAWSQHICPDS